MSDGSVVGSGISTRVGRLTAKGILENPSLNEWIKFPLTNKTNEVDPYQVLELLEGSLVFNAAGNVSLQGELLLEEQASFSVRIGRYDASGTLIANTQVELSTEASKTLKYAYDSEYQAGEMVTLEICFTEYKFGEIVANCEVESTEGSVSGGFSGDFNDLTNVPSNLGADPQTAVNTTDIATNVTDISNNTTAIAGLSTVATSGDYNDLTNLPDLSNVGSGSGSSSAAISLYQAEVSSTFTKAGTTDTIPFGEDILVKGTDITKDANNSDFMINTDGSYKVTVHIRSAKNSNVSGDFRKLQIRRKDATGSSVESHFIGFQEVITSSDTAYFNTMSGSFVFDCVSGEKLEVLHRDGTSLSSIYNESYVLIEKLSGGAASSSSSDSSGSGDINLVVAELASNFTKTSVSQDIPFSVDKISEGDIIVRDTVNPNTTFKLSEAGLYKVIVEYDTAKSEVAGNQMRVEVLQRDSSSALVESFPLAQQEAVSTNVTTRTHSSSLILNVSADDTLTFRHWENGNPSTITTDSYISIEKITGSVAPSATPPSDGKFASLVLSSLVNLTGSAVVIDFDTIRDNADSIITEHSSAGTWEIVEDGLYTFNVSLQVRGPVNESDFFNVLLRTGLSDGNQIEILELGREEFYATPVSDTQTYTTFSRSITLRLEATNNFQLQLQGSSGHSIRNSQGLTRVEIIKHEVGSSSSNAGSSSGPKMAVYKPSADVDLGTGTIIPFDSEQENVDGITTLDATGRVEIVEAGFYMISVSIEWGRTDYPAGAFNRFTFSINPLGGGSVIASEAFHRSIVPTDLGVGNGRDTAYGTISRYLNVGDSIRINGTSTGDGVSTARSSFASRLEVVKIG